MTPRRKIFYERANSAFIVTVRTQLNSLKSVNTYYDVIMKNASKDINIIISGDKSDLVNENAKKFAF